MFDLAFPCDLEGDVSDVILLEILGVIKSAPRFVRGPLEVPHFVTLEGNGGSGTSTKCLVLCGVGLLPCLGCPSGTRCVPVVPSNLVVPGGRISALFQPFSVLELWCELSSESCWMRSSVPSGEPDCREAELTLECVSALGLELVRAGGSLPWPRPSDFICCSSSSKTRLGWICGVYFGGVARDWQHKV